MGQFSFIPVFVVAFVSSFSNCDGGYVINQGNGYGRFAKPGVPGGDLSLISHEQLEKLFGGIGIFNLGADVKKIVFSLYSLQNQYMKEILELGNPKSFKHSSWDKSQGVKLVIHGYIEDGSDGPFSPSKKIISAYQEMRRPENLVFVDWRFLSRQLIYDTSARNTEDVGMRVAEFLYYLRRVGYISSLEQVHIIGFSLGAHAASVAGVHANAMLNEKVGRITGLDPAGPAFYNVDKAFRLDPSDAIFVDVIHTNMGYDITHFGTAHQSGHLDFYPNGGEYQPGCGFLIFGEIVGVCSHIKATDYFCNSIRGEAYWSCPCSVMKLGACSCTTNNAVLMGEYVNSNSTNGKYYLAIPLDQRSSKRMNDLIWSHSNY